MFVVSRKPKKSKFIIKKVFTNLISNPKTQSTQINIINTNINISKNQIPKLNNQNEKNQTNINQSNQQIIKKIFPRKQMFKLTFVRSSQNQNKHKTKSELSANNLIKNNNKQRKNNISNIKYSCGRWKEDEHKRFIEAIIKYGNDWKQVQKYVKTRSSTQARSHAQKFFVKIKKSKVLDFNLDLSKTSIKMFHDMIKEAPVDKYNKILNALNSVAFERGNNKKKKVIENNNNNNLNNNIKNNNLCNNNNEFEKEKDLNNSYCNNNNNLNESFSNEIVNQINPNNNGSNIKYILRQLINNLADDKLDMNDNYQNLASRKISIDSNFDNKSFISRRRKRSSISSFKEIPKGINEEIIYHNPFGDYLTGNNFNFGNDKDLFSINNSRKVSQDDDYLLNILKIGKKNTT